LGSLETAIGVTIASVAATAANNLLFLGCNLNRRYFFLPWSLIYSKSCYPYFYKRNRSILRAVIPNRQNLNYLYFY
jgi:hypothetical protein